MSPPNFSALRDLHNLANDLLHSPIIQQALSHQEKWVDEVSEASLTMLDVCGTTRDVLLLAKDHFQDLQSSFRRIRIGKKMGFNNKIASDNLYKKKLKKQMIKCLRSLKGMKNKYCSFNLDNLSTIDTNFVIVVNVLREMRLTFISIVESLFSLMSMPQAPDQKSTKASMTSMLNILHANGQSLSDKHDEMVVQDGKNKRLEAVEMAIEDLEVELDCMFRRLIQTRVSLLNLLSN